MWSILWTTDIIKWMNLKSEFCLYFETDGVKYKQKNLIFFVSKYKQKRPTFMLLLCFFKQIIFFNVKLNANCIQFVLLFIFSIIFLPNENYFYIFSWNLFQREHKKLYLKLISVSFINKCELIFFSYKLGRREYDSLFNLILYKWHA